MGNCLLKRTSTSKANSLARNTVSEKKKLQREALRAGEHCLCDPLLLYPSFKKWKKTKTKNLYLVPVLGTIIFRAQTLLSEHSVWFCRLYLLQWTLCLSLYGGLTFQCLLSLVFKASMQRELLCVLNNSLRYFANWPNWGQYCSPEPTTTLCVCLCLCVCVSVCVCVCVCVQNEVYWRIAWSHML